MFNLEYIKALEKRLDQVEAIVTDHLAAREGTLRNLEAALRKEFQADLATQKAVLTQQFNTAIATLEQRIQFLQNHKAGSTIRSEEGQSDLYEKQVDRVIPSDRIPF